MANRATATTSSTDATDATAVTTSETPADENVSAKESAQVEVSDIEAPESEAPDPMVTVEYTGTKPYGRTFVGERSIKKADLKKIGITHDGDLVFTPMNGWRQEIPANNTALVEYFDKTDSGFKIV
jgi:hypothetical protein